MEKIVVTAAGMKNNGGWQLDTQFVTTMGMPYLLAHGLGNPVKDAKTEFEVKKTGEYELYVYTFNWVAPWNKEEAPGIFEVYVDNKKAGAVFGANTPQWGWEKGGQVHLEEGVHTLKFHDLTGFEGRVGMVVFSEDPEISLPTDARRVSQFVYQAEGSEVPEEEGMYDLVICGAGIPGICAALSAARNGLKVALIQDRPVVGGNNSSEVRVWLGGETNFEPFPGIGNIINEMEQQKVGHYGKENQPENYEDDKKIALLRAEKNITLYLGHIMTEVEMRENRIISVIVWDYRVGRRKKIQGKLFSDCTGDGTLGYMAGADYEVTTNGHMGMTNIWYVEETEEKQSFPRCPWAIDLRGVNFPGKVAADGKVQDRSLGCWFWESGCEHDPIEKAEYARDLNFRAMYGAWDTLKNAEGSYENWKLGFSAYIGGKRESRRLFGDVILTKSDASKEVCYEDACVPSTWQFDVHYPDKRFYEAFREGDAFLTEACYDLFRKPYFIPYRTLYSRNIANLFMAGRNVSVSHDALGTVRVMRTGGMMGEVIGYAARICRKYDVDPRQVYQQHLDEFVGNLKAIPKCNPNPLVANVD